MGGVSARCRSYSRSSRMWKWVYWRKPTNCNEEVCVGLVLIGWTGNVQRIPSLDEEAVKGLVSLDWRRGSAAWGGNLVWMSCQAGIVLDLMLGWKMLPNNCLDQS